MGQNIELLASCVCVCENIGNGTWGIKWSRYRRLYETLIGQGRDTDFAAQCQMPMSIKNY